MIRQRLAIALAVMLGTCGISGGALASGGEKGDSAVAQQNNLPVDPLTVTVFSDMRVRGLLAVDLSLELAKPDERGRIEKIMPRLRDRYLTSLTRFAANRVDVNRTVDIEALSRMLQGITDETLGKQAARILIGGASVRRL